MAVTIKLSRPITEGEDTITELELREPGVADVGDLGYPFLIHTTDGDGKIELRPKIIIKYASRLGSVPPSTITRLSLGDFSAVQEAIMGFFGQTAATPPPPASAPTQTTL